MTLHGNVRLHVNLGSHFAWQFLYANPISRRLEAIVYDDRDFGVLVSFESHKKCDKNIRPQPLMVGVFDFIYINRK